MSLNSQEEAISVVGGNPQTVTWQLPKRVELTIRGRSVSLMSPMHIDAIYGYALLALDDPRVDAVLNAIGCIFVDADGKQFWPPIECGAKDGCP